MQESDLHITPLSADFAVCGQIHPRDADTVGALGFRTILCARPDGEAPDQPAFAEIKKQAQATGLAVHYLPVPSSGASPAQHTTLAAALMTLPKPVLAYCRSGQRIATLWHAVQNPVT